MITLCLSCVEVTPARSHGLDKSTSTRTFLSVVPVVSWAHCVAVLSVPIFVIAVTTVALSERLLMLTATAGRNATVRHLLEWIPA